MVNLFGKSRFGKSLLGLERSVAKRKASRRNANLWSDVESLEARQVLTVNVTFTGGSLYLTGNADDTPTITFAAGPPFNVTLTTATYTGNTSGSYLVTGHIFVNLSSGNNAVTLAGTGIFTGDVNVNLGNGTNSVTVTGTPQVRDLKVTGGTGSDTELINGLTARSITINNGTGASSATIAAGAGASAVSTSGSVSITNGSSGGADQSTILGTAGTALNVGTTSGNLTVNQGSAAVHTVTLTNTEVVNGSLQITTGAGTGGTTVGLTDADASGDLKITNGNVTGAGLGHAVTVAGGSVIGGNVTIYNGTTSIGGGETNAITIDDSSFGAAGKVHTFTNLASENNDVIFGNTTANTITGSVTVSNASSLAGDNDITVAQGTFTGTVSLTNNYLPATPVQNNITVGELGAVVYNGNWTVTNGRAILAASSNEINISNLGGTGNLTVSNGVSASNNVTLGEFAANTIGGSLTSTNYDSASRETIIDRTSVSGAAGVKISHVGAGNSTIELGNTVGVGNVRINGGGLSITDGTGINNVRLEDTHVAGNFTYGGTGGAADTVTLGRNTPAGVDDFVRILGNTVINTGIGADTVNIGGADLATDGFAAFRGSVTVGLGAGNDNIWLQTAYTVDPVTLVLTPTIYNFQFNGGAGTDRWHINDDTAVSDGSDANVLSDISPLTSEVQAKLVSFEGDPTLGNEVIV